MKYIKFLFVGIIFGYVMSKSEALSWYRIYEMFKFQSFHMYGIIGSAVILGVIGVGLIKKYKVKNIYAESISFTPKAKSVPRYLFGGVIFGFGWALVGACPGPMFTLIGHGAWSILIVIFFSIIGTFLYGIVKKHLPH